MGRQSSSYVSLSLEQNNLLCEKHKAEPSLTHTQLARWATQQFQTQGDVKRSTVQGILKRSADFVDVPDSQRQRKRRCSVAICASDQKVMQKLAEYKTWHDNATIKGSTVQKVALREGVELPSGGRLSRGWLYRFQQRTGLWFSLRHGEGGLLDQDLVDEGRKDLRAVDAGYRPQDVYNMDETALFYRREPRGSLTVDKKEKGKKQSKQRITVCVATNTDGTDRLPLHFIGKSKVPIPLRNRDVLAEIGATYTNTAKAWMNTVKYCEWLLELNERMRQEGRHILLLVDNVSSHDDGPAQLPNVVIHKLPPNPTAALQPMDQGIIKSLKDEYQEKKEDAELDMFYSGVAYKPVDIFSAMKWLSEGWGDISTKTIRNCWCHTGIVSKMDMVYLLN